MTTLKIKYEFANGEDRFLFKRYLRQYASCLHFVYNRAKEGIDGKETRSQVKQLNNIELLDSWLVENCFHEVDCIINKEKATKSTKNIVFGGKKNLLRRQKNLISNDEWQEIKLGCMSVTGEANKKGNRKFRIEDGFKTILFKPFRKKNEIRLKLPNLKKGIVRILKKLRELQESSEIPISWKANLDYVYISFDESKVFEKKVELKSKKNRVLAIDMNPNYIGWSVVDWMNERDFKIVKTGCYSFKDLNDKQFALKLTKKQREELKRKERLALTSKAKIKNSYFSNKRKHEIIEVAKDLMNVAKSCQCELVVVEDLNIKSQDRSKGKKLNRLCNSFFIRNAFVNNLNKRCNIEGMKMLKVVPQYSSFIGNFLYRGLKLPDPILASIELGRRGYEFNAQYIEKSKEKSKTIVQPNLKKFDDLIAKSLEEFGIKEKFKDLVDLYYLFKKDSGMMYRVPFRSDSKWSQFKNMKSHVSRLGISLPSLYF